MEITVHFSQWHPNTQNNPPDLIFSWDRTFNTIRHLDDTFELAFGYIYALILLKPKTATIDVSINTVNYKHYEYLRLPNIRQHFLAINVHPPRIDDTLARYLTRIKRQIIKDYIIVIIPNSNDERHVHVVQFNKVSFLQGFISVLRGFNEGTVDYIVTI